MSALRKTCRGGYGIRQIIGDSRIDCTVANNRLDEEDIDADNVLNLTTAERDQEKWHRYIVNLADPSKFTRLGKCGPPPCSSPASRAAHATTSAGFSFEFPFAPLTTRSVNRCCGARGRFASR